MRRFLMVEVSEQEKKNYKIASNERGFRSVSHWIRFLAHRDIKKIEREYEKNKQ